MNVNNCTCCFSIQIFSATVVRVEGVLLVLLRRRSRASVRQQRYMVDDVLKSYVVGILGKPVRFGVAMLEFLLHSKAFA